MDVSNLIPLGFALIFIGLLLIMAGSINKGDVHWGIGGFIGPIPFGFANSRNALYTVAAISVIAFLVLLVNSKFLLGK